MLAWVQCSSDRFTGASEHTLWFLCTSVTRSVASFEGVIADPELVKICHHAVALSSHHTQHVSLHQLSGNACIGVMHI